MFFQKVVLIRKNVIQLPQPRHCQSKPARVQAALPRVGSAACNMGESEPPPHIFLPKWIYIICLQCWINIDWVTTKNSYCICLIGKIIWGIVCHLRENPEEMGLLCSAGHCSTWQSYAQWIMNEDQKWVQSNSQIQNINQAPLIALEKPRLLSEPSEPRLLYKVCG